MDLGLKNILLLKEMENQLSIVSISFFCMLLKSLSYLSVEESFIPKLMVYRPSLLSWRVHADFLEKQQLRDSSRNLSESPHSFLACSLHSLVPELLFRWNCSAKYKKKFSNLFCSLHIDRQESYQACLSNRFSGWF